jgi:formylmethanofuran dehydrogenase subunit E
MGSQVRKLNRVKSRKAKAENEDVVCRKCGKVLDEGRESVAWDKEGDLCEVCFEGLYMVQLGKAEI